MNTIKDAKTQYDNIQIPPELSERVTSAIAMSDFHKNQPNRSPLFKRYFLTAGACLAGITLLFTLALNTSTSFAKEMQELPVIGIIARVLTFRFYVSEEDGIKTSVEIPSLEIDSADTDNLADTINNEIEKFCQQYEEEAKQGLAEYKKAFLETGGTEEEWVAHQFEINISYEIKSQSDEYLSFTVEGGQNWSSAYTQKKYYNINLKTGQLVTLSELLGEDFISVADKSIQQQIEERTQKQNAFFFPPEQGGFTGITETPNFYISEAGYPVIVFAKYEIAPGSEGEIEFEIIP